MQELFNEQLQTLKEALLHHLRLITDVDSLLTIEVSVVYPFHLDCCVDLR